MMLFPNFARLFPSSRPHPVRGHHSLLGPRNPCIPVASCTIIVQSVTVVVVRVLCLIFFTVHPSVCLPLVWKRGLKNSRDHLPHIRIDPRPPPKMKTFPGLERKSPIEKKPSINFSYTYVLGTATTTMTARREKEDCRRSTRVWEGNTTEREEIMGCERISSDPLRRESRLFRGRDGPGVRTGVVGGKEFDAGY